MGKATNAVLEELHEQVAKDLLAKIKSGEATSAELNAAINFLKNNGIEALPTVDNPLGNLASELPDFPDPQDIVPN